MVGVENLKGTETENVAIHDGETLEGKILQMFPDRGIDIGGMFDDTTDQFRRKFADKGVRGAKGPEGLQLLRRDLDDTLNIESDKKLHGGFSPVTARRRGFLFGVLVPGG
jgi:hypothetical protein